MFPPTTLLRLGASPEAPTDALPGSEEKIRIMTQRAERRQKLFHPLDGPRARLHKPPLEKSGLFVPPLHSPETERPAECSCVTTPALV